MFTYTVQTNNAAGRKFWQDKIDKHSAEHVNTSTGTYLDPKIVAKGYVNIITIENIETGEVKVYDTRVVDGVSYTLDGRRVVPGGNPNQGGLVPGGVEAITHFERVPEENATYIRYSPISMVPVYRDEYETVKVGENRIYPELPAKPVFESYDVPEPTFNAELKQEDRFIYAMGIDRVEINMTVIKDEGLHVTLPIKINDANAIELVVDMYRPEKAGIEFSIIDGDKTIPILANGESIVYNELLFPNMPTRFAMDGEPIEIKKDGTPVNMTLQDARNRRDGKYSVTYRAQSGIRYTPTSTSIKIATVMRIFNREDDMPYINGMKLKLIGGGSTLWQDK